MRDGTRLQLVILCLSHSKEDSMRLFPGFLKPPSIHATAVLKSVDFKANVHPVWPSHKSNKAGLRKLGCGKQGRYSAM
eukprot:4696745-Pleurochrysis_carterae.AAC.4